jgi:hypothetical protein
LKFLREDHFLWQLLQKYFGSQGAKWCFRRFPDDNITTYPHDAAFQLQTATGKLNANHTYNSQGVVLLVHPVSGSRNAL